MEEHMLETMPVQFVNAPSRAVGWLLEGDSATGATNDGGQLKSNTSDSA